MPGWWAVSDGLTARLINSFDSGFDRLPEALGDKIGRPTAGRIELEACLAELEQAMGDTAG